MTTNQGNVFKMMRTVGCSWKQAEKALKNTYTWPDAYKYAKQLME